MEKDLLKSLVNYFLTLEKIDKKWRECCTVVGKALDGLKDFSEQLRHVTSKEVDNAEICMIENVREKLIFKIKCRIEEEFRSIVDSIHNLGNFNQELKNKLIQLERMRSKVFINDPKMKEIVEGTPYRPRLNLLLEWAIESQDYYQQLYNKINDNFKAVDETKAETIVQLTDAFAYKGKRSTIDRILGFTQFLTKETIR